jgi:hypothetical protein
MRKAPPDARRTAYPGRNRRLKGETALPASDHQRGGGGKAACDQPVESGLPPPERRRQTVVQVRQLVHLSPRTSRHSSGGWQSGGQAGDASFTAALNSAFEHASGIDPMHVPCRIPSECRRSPWSS